MEKKSFSTCGRGERSCCEAVSPRLLFLEKSGRRRNRTSKSGNGSESAKHSFLPFFPGNLYGIVVIKVAHVFEKLVELVVFVKHVGYVEHRIVSILVFCVDESDHLFAFPAEKFHPNIHSSLPRTESGESSQSSNTGRDVLAVFVPSLLSDFPTEIPGASRSTMKAVIPQLFFDLSVLAKVPRPSHRNRS